MNFPYHFSKLSDADYDVVIIGGGINGAGIARELVLRGLSVALFEKGDFGSGTSSMSSKLIHGGLRYLEMGAFRLVREACRERHYLLANAPHLVKPLSFLIPIYKQRFKPKWLLRLGLFLYDVLAGVRGIKLHTFIDREEALRREPWLKKEGLDGAAVYFDAQMNDARLCLETVLQAKQFGADVFNYVAVTGIRFDGEDATSVTVQHQMTQEAATLATRYVINAAGPWGQDILEALGIETPRPILRKSKGIHLITKRLTNVNALLLSSESDQRIFFVIPWGPYSLVGTTDTEYEGPVDGLSATSADVAYLTQTLHNYFPDMVVEASDIFSTFAGLRPLLPSPKKRSYGVSREHKIVRHTDNVMSVVGGKYTTFRAVSEQVARMVLRHFGKAGGFRSLTKRLPSWGGEISDVQAYIDQHYEVEGEIYLVSKEVYAHIISTYGSEYQNVLSILASSEKYQTFLSVSDVLVGEVIYAIRHEMALTVTDFMRRRTDLFFVEGNGLACLDEVADIFAAELDWDEDTKVQMKAAYRQQVDEALSFRKHLGEQ